MGNKQAIPQVRISEQVVKAVCDYVSVTGRRTVIDAKTLCELPPVYKFVTDNHISPELLIRPIESALQGHGYPTVLKQNTDDTWSIIVV